MTARLQSCHSFATTVVQVFRIRIAINLVSQRQLVRKESNGTKYPLRYIDDQKKPSEIVPGIRENKEAEDKNRIQTKQVYPKGSSSEAQW
ncbi:hypothetical protein Desti_0854 [Desulfomonile tiedjei DSM 6799]|uniref:Uncharacterized protein n=1 Tax=Desulfomonile tiedjei (strain ATCC 49306 / DSM 6799 / DCB-1) TaxID=706587 RepID=I4C1Y6_DESTA|nr:hypothetical protein Desti_0854 [Desulfomonile tiedjei DSM 6799]